MKAKAHVQMEEFLTHTADLSLQAKGAWMGLRLWMVANERYVLDTSYEHLCRVLQCSSDILRSILAEFEVSICCGFRLEKPPPNGACTENVQPLYGGCTENVRLVYEPDEKVALSLLSESLRISKRREDKNKEERFRMPENWDLNKEMHDFGVKNGMCTETVRHEFEKCKLYHERAQNEWTMKGWNGLVFRTWVMGWIDRGRQQYRGTNQPKVRSMVDLL